MAWSTSGNLHSSPDGANWTSTPIDPGSISIGPAAASDDGVVVAVRGGWDVWYDDQEFYRSENGVDWEVLQGDTFVGGHPIRAMTFGYGSPSRLCPGR
jgi:hypothetical protein